MVTWLSTLQQCQSLSGMLPGNVRLLVMWFNVPVNSFVSCWNGVTTFSVLNSTAGCEYVLLKDMVRSTWCKNPGPVSSESDAKTTKPWRFFFSMVSDIMSRIMRKMEFFL